MTEKEVLAEIEQATRDGRRTVLNLSNQGLKILPPEIGKLTRLRRLLLFGNQLESLPAEIGQLTNLKELSLYSNKLKSLPPEIGKLTNLRRLVLSRNRLTFLPPEIGSLTKLYELKVAINKLTTLPPEIGKMTNLYDLSFSQNQLLSIPTEIGELQKLVYFDLWNNLLTSLPVELGKIQNLFVIVDANPLRSPPPDVLNQGKKAILAYLRERLDGEAPQWLSKMILVGEGGVGKTQLLRSLLNETFETESETTHGIGIRPLELKHPEKTDVRMLLNCWDFGGQQIYHATHQFFLTNRSLFVLVWDTRHGWKAGKLYYWLDTIKARAPESPVLIVAAHTDERDADLPLEDLKKKYSQVVGHFELSNKTRAGILEFRKALLETAADLPLMGEMWPLKWLNAASAIRGLKEHHILPTELDAIMTKHRVEGKNSEVLTQWLHELGDIVYFRENEELDDLVILNPQWVTEAISKVLESKEVITKDGIFTREQMDKLWGGVGDKNIQEHLLRLMEQFDLSYRTLENKEISLVVERLPLDPPAYQEKWNAAREKEGSKQISMKFSLTSFQAGLPTWFIARSHRFTTHTHWRLGALFADGEARRHYGLIEGYEYDRYLRLTVQGPVPANFFALLRDGLELTLDRFPGLDIKRTIPCPGHDGKDCSYEFDLENVERAAEKNRDTIECTKALEHVKVSKLLYGLHESTLEQQLQELSKLQDKTLLEVEGSREEILAELKDNKSLIQRGFTTMFNAMQKLEESHCPNVFAVLPKEGLGWTKKLTGQKMVLQLFCQAPGCWHPTYDGGLYDIKQPSKWLKSIGPYILKLAKVIKYAAPVAGVAAGTYTGPIGVAMGAEYATKLAGQIKLTEELSKRLSKRDFVEWELLEGCEGEERPERIEGAQLRALRLLLDEVDSEHYWGGLKKVLTPEGHYLWLCNDHAKEYKD